MLAGSIAQVKDELVISFDHVHEHYLHAFSAISSAPRNEENLAGALAESKDPTPIFSFPRGTNDQPNNPTPGVLVRLKIEEDTIKATLKSHKGNITGTAKALGISRQLLSYRLAKFGINAKDYR
jgi:DNA-binding NtrC family response regulator